MNHLLQVKCLKGWLPMQLAPNQPNSAIGTASQEPPFLLLVLPGCYHLADTEKDSSWETSYRECNNMGGTLFYATNDLDVAWLSKKLTSLPGQRHVPLNLHRFLYNVNGWAWAPYHRKVGMFII